MMGLLLWKEPREGRKERAVTVSERAVLHMRFTCGEVLRGPRTPEPLVRKRVRRAAKQLRKLGITQAVLPEAFPYQEELAKLGIRPVCRCGGLWRRIGPGRFWRPEVWRPAPPGWRYPEDS